MLAPMLKCLGTLAVLAAAACSPNGGSITTSLHGVTYRFPKEDLNTVLLPPEGRTYVRLEPREANFHLVLDEWAHHASPHGPHIPRISRLSDNRFRDVTLVASPGGPVVCKRGPQPYFNCGIRIEHGPVKWGVLFDKSEIGRAEQIRVQAGAAIRGYQV